MTAERGPSIVEFVRARLTEDEQVAVLSPPRAMRELAFKQVVCDQVLQAMGPAVVAHPWDEITACGLLPLAGVWSDHPDFAPRSWFPRLHGELRPS